MTSTGMITAEQLIEQLNLSPHSEGGFFRRTFESADRIISEQRSEKSPRLAVTMIYYLLTQAHPIGCWHRNRSTIVHLYQLGAPLTYWLLYPDGTLRQTVLGPDLSQGHKLQLTVPGGVWKASQLITGEFGLISEVVTPGFCYEDRELASLADIAVCQQHPSWQQLLALLPKAHDI